jgi:MerR family transcriptional regulator/heat shock protein HspR
MKPATDEKGQSRERAESGRETAVGAPAPTAPPPPAPPPFEEPQSGMLKIGEVARRLGISVQTVRLYESEGVVISFRSSGGTRWYCEEDIRWIGQIRSMMAEGLNFEGIRRLLAQLPCWALKPCRPEDHAACAMRLEHRVPCWLAPEKLCTEQLRHCYHCRTYRRAWEFLNLKANAQVVPLEEPGG